MPKQPFDVRSAVVRLRKAVEPYPKAALFELVSEGFDSVFEVLVACIISIRTRDETTIPVAKKLFARARTPKAIARLSVDEIDELIGASTFHRGKAGQIHAIAERTVRELKGVLPCDSETLQTFQGVGPKCANLAVGIVCGEALIGVDVHVHRVTNRWGIVAAPTPISSTLSHCQKQGSFEANLLL
jgi:endonuclease-3